MSSKGREISKMKTWNTPELRELSINSTAGGDIDNDIEDGKSIYDPDHHCWWHKHGEDENYTK